MEFFLEIALQVFFEFLMQIFGEIISEIGIRSLTEVFENRKVRNPWLASFGYLLIGAAVGGISLLVVRSTLIHSSTLRVLNLILTPLLAGLVMALIGLLRQRKGQQLVRLDRFGYGFIFAFGMALIRFAFAARPV
jgi:hypothetical protein